MISRICQATSLVCVFLLPAGCDRSQAPVSDPLAAEPVAPDEIAIAAAETSGAVLVSAEDSADSSDVESETGTLVVRFEYGGDAAAPPVIAAGAGFCGQLGLVDERLLVHPENNGISNVVLYVYTGRGGSKLPEFPPRGKTITLANQNCRFEPHITLMQSGDKLHVTNPDAVGHSTNIGFFNNKGGGLMIPAVGEFLITLDLSEPAPIPVDCNIHPWMKAYLVVLDHPYAAVSDENGDLIIEGLPVGEKLVFRAYHEAGPIKKVKVDGKLTEWKRSRFEVEIQPGMNDLGTVVIPADSLR